MSYEHELVEFLEQLYETAEQSDNSTDASNDALHHFEQHHHTLHQILHGCEQVFKPLALITGTAYWLYYARKGFHDRIDNDPKTRSQQHQSALNDARGVAATIALGITAAAAVSTGVGFLACLTVGFGFSVIKDIGQYWHHSKTLKATEQAHAHHTRQLKRILAKPTSNWGVVDQHRAQVHAAAICQHHKTRQKLKQKRHQLIKDIAIGVASTVALAVSIAFPPATIACLGVVVGIGVVRGAKSLFGWAKKKFFGKTVSAQTQHKAELQQDYQALKDAVGDDGMNQLGLRLDHANTPRKAEPAQVTPQAKTAKTSTPKPTVEIEMISVKKPVAPTPVSVTEREEIKGQDTPFETAMESPVSASTALVSSPIDSAKP